MSTESPDALAEGLPRRWIGALMAAKAYDDIEAMALIAILNRPGDVWAVGKLQYFRVQALLAQKKFDEALVEAKKVYNVGPLQDTEGAINLVAECLANTKAKDDPKIIRRFKMQQVTGAQPPKADGTATSPSNVVAPPDGGLGENILKTIKVDPTPYAEAIEKAKENNSFRSLLGRGNLLLLADRPSEAKACFELAYDLANAQQLVVATEAVARSIRAEDGTVGRANAYLISLQQPAQPDASPAK